ncbi:hypothetical protein MIDIC_230041 [Alphaproteobacteria bacterium]
MLIKNKSNLVAKVIKKVKELHPYHAPCIAEIAQYRMSLWFFYR